MPGTRPEVLHGVRAEVPVREQAGLPDDDQGVLRKLSDQAVSVHEDSRVKANPSEGLSHKEGEEVLGLQRTRVCHQTGNSQ